MLASAQPASSGITTQAESASSDGDQRREQEHDLVGAGRDHRLLEHELQQVGEALQQAERADDVGAAAHLHGRPDLAVGEQDVGGEDQQRDEQQQALVDEADFGAPAEDRDAEQVVERCER